MQEGILTPFDGHTPFVIVHHRTLLLFALTIHMVLAYLIVYLFTLQNLNNYKWTRLFDHVFM